MTKMETIRPIMRSLYSNEQLPSLRLESIIMSTRVDSLTRVLVVPIQLFFTKAYKELFQMVCSNQIWNGP